MRIEAMVKSFGEFKRGDVRGIHDFCGCCERELRPCVWVEQNRKYSGLFWTLCNLPITFDYWYRAEFEKQFIERVMGGFLVCCGPKSHYEFSLLHGKIEGLTIDDARRLAAFVYSELIREVRRARRLARYV